MRCRLLALSSAVALGMSIVPAIASAQRAFPRHCDRTSYDCGWSDRADRAFDRAERNRERADERVARAQDRADAQRARVEERAFRSRPDDLARREDRAMRARDRAEVRERAVRARRMRLDW